MSDTEGTVDPVQAIVEGQNKEDVLSAPAVETVDTVKEQQAAAFAALSRKEKAFRDKELGYKTKTEELEARIAELTKEPEKESLEIRLRKDPLGTLKEFGMDFDKLTDITLNDGKLPADMQMQIQLEEMKRNLEAEYGSKFQSLEEKLANKEKEEAQKANSTQEQKFRDEISSFLEAEKDETGNLKYELIQLTGNQDMVYDLISSQYKETQRILTKEEASKTVEDYLTEQLKTLEASSKLKSMFQPSEPSQKENEGSPAVNTLTNNMSTGGAHEAKKPFNNQESLDTAAKLLKWND